ncbi:MAG: F0F1 ATP synthase subunit A [Patescibacteria group bacterium]
MPEISIKAEELFELWHIPITNSILLALVTCAFLLVIGLILRGRLALIPGKLQSVVELLMEQVLGLMDSVFGSREKSEKYLPMILTVFLFILFSNWFGLLPIVGPVGLRHVAEHHGEVKEVLVPLFRAPSADLNFTIALAVLAVFSVNVLSVLALGIVGFIKRFFSKDIILSAVGILEIISEFVKIISFSFRLFGNVFAGEVLLLIIGFLVPLIVPLPFLFLEVFVGFMQAFIFAMLTMVFMAMATTEHAH